MNCSSTHAVAGVEVEVEVEVVAVAVAVAASFASCEVGFS
jgi:hypothetical protein